MTHPNFDEALDHIYAALGYTRVLEPKNYATNATEHLEKAAKLIMPYTNKKEAKDEGPGVVRPAGDPRGKPSCYKP